MGTRDILFVGVIVGGACALAAGFFRPAVRDPAPRPAHAPVPADIQAIVAEVDSAFRQRWQAEHLTPTSPAPELAVMRRLSLALTGSIPSLEEIRRFEARPSDNRLEAWLDDLLRDRRTADYLAERFTRAFVGVEDGPFLLFRRRRFRTWLSDAILENRRYDAIVRDLIADRGLWTDHPATNFISVTFNPETGRPDPERLGARAARAFLGVRLDCAQCHDHPFQPWKQADFRGLSAFFGSIRSNLRGIHDADMGYEPPDRKTRKPVTVEPRVPFRPELLPSTGTSRERLAAWVVDPRNPNFALATVNRVWALLFGRPLAEPIDDLPATAELHPVLRLLAADFSAHGYNLHRLIRILASTRAFRLESAGDEAASAARDAAWAAFPLTRLRPEQVAGAIFQSASLTALDGDDFWLARLALYTGRNDFVGRYGDTGEDEFDARGGTIPQRLLLMNGDLVQSKIKDGLFNASTRIAQLAPDDRKAVEVAYLAVLTRRPTADESAHFAAKLAGTRGQPRKERLTDLYWTLLNVTEFSWNH